MCLLTFEIEIEGSTFITSNHSKKRPQASVINRGANDRMTILGVVNEVLNIVQFFFFFFFFSFDTLSSFRIFT